MESLEQVAGKGLRGLGQPACSGMGNVLEWHLPALVMRKMRAVAMQRKSMNSLFPIILIAIGIAGCSADAEARLQPTVPATSAADDAALGDSGCEAAKRLPLEGILDSYQVLSVEKYRGGLTTREEARARIGSDVIITANRFSLDDRESSAPRYSLQCHDITRSEGEVPTGRERLLGPFFGLGADREVVWEITVEDGRSGDYLAAFEVVPQGGSFELWRLYDGWVYVLSSAGAADDR